MQASEARGGDETFIIGRLADHLFLIHAPLIALLLAWIWSSSDLSVTFVPWGIRYKNTFLQFFVAVFTYAHIVLVFARTHLNSTIFRQYYLRFTVVPALLLLAFYSSNELAIAGAAISSIWDPYHSAQQTFGLGRMYDARAGNDPEVGRRADQLINLVFYIGPILGGAVLIDHLRFLTPLSRVGPAFFAQAPVIGESHAALVSRVVIGLSLPMVVAYVAYYVRLGAKGYRVSPKKVALLASTALCSLWAWGFNPWGKAFFIMNFFHAMQYFALVWWAEKKNLARRIGLPETGRGFLLALGVLIAVTFPVGVALELGSNNFNSRILYCLALTASLMHFWADGFVWSVRRKQV